MLSLDDLVLDKTGVSQKGQCQMKQIINTTFKRNFKANINP